MEAIASAIRPFFLTSIGKKYLMGFTGLIWAGFVLSHMAGNLLIFIGPDAYNKYGHAIVSGGILIPAEIILVLALIVHVTMAIWLTLENRAARGQQRYAVTPKGEKGGNWASRTMAIQGSLILAFVILHLATFKYGTYYETTVDGVTMRDLHRLMVEVFQRPGYVVWYVVALIFLGLHLRHGVGSIFQSFGLKNDHYAPLIQKISIGYGLIVALGFMAQPLYIFFSAR
ncbi:MAG: succinate dehydrogenase cytochrome b subunit [Pseudobdellovibrionaceae bacterium]